MSTPPKEKQICVIIDDDPLSIFLSRTVIQQALKHPTTIDFTSPVKGLAFIKEVCGSDLERIILFLDLNMPVLDGAGFLRKFDEFSEEEKSKVEIVILTSSINSKDILIASTNPHVSAFISKPLNEETVRRIAGKHGEVF